MTDTQHTPAPWELGKDGYGQDGYIYCDNDFGTAIAIVYGKGLMLTGISEQEAKANAQLMVCAPELLHEMESLAKALEDVHDVPDSFLDAIRKARTL